MSQSIRGATETYFFNEDVCTLSVAQQPPLVTAAGLRLSNRLPITAIQNTNSKLADFTLLAPRTTTGYDATLTITTTANKGQLPTANHTDSFIAAVPGYRQAKR